MDVKICEKCREYSLLSKTCRIRKKSSKDCKRFVSAYGLRQDGM